MRLSRSAALAYRCQVHEIDGSVRSIASVAVLAAGVQDTPPGTTAARAIAVRLGAAPEAELPESLALVHSMRGTMHVHRAADLGLLATALRPDEAADLLRSTFGPFFTDAAAAGVPVGAAYDEVAGSMAAVMSDGVARSKGELSSALNEVVDERLRPWCAGCGVAHVHDGLFRLASLPAGLRLVPLGDASAEFVAGPGPAPVATGGGAGRGKAAAGTAGGEGGGGAREEARKELVRRYLHFCGPTSRDGLAAWLGLAPAAARRWWALVEGELEPVEVDGRRLAMHRDDLVDAKKPARPPATATLLPPYDPMVELCDRELLLPDPAQRKQLWRAAANPGVVLVGGEVVGVWRRRKGVLTVTNFANLSATRRAEIARATDGEVVFD